ncbi:MAG: glutamine-hydrolyzing carbamoyl-phosphate synthase small subunit [Bernardetiaceae bacterium]
MSLTTNQDYLPAKAVLLLQDGTRFEGVSIGATGTAGGEICFNTGMTGYQEIYTDPSYYGQIIINTHSHIGNYGALDQETESGRAMAKGIVVRNFSHVFSRPTGQSSLQDYLVREGVIGIANIDTRQLVRHIRQRGAMNALISSEDLSEEALQEQLRAVPDMKGLELSSRVSTPTPYTLGDEAKADFRVAVLDLGVKRSILKNFVERNCVCRVFPSTTTFAQMQDWQPDGYFISNGPGDPSAMPAVVQTVKSILDAQRPLFGICLGHQILALSVGLNTYKMHHGHRGLNHPVKNLITGTCEITSQNHGFAVGRDQLPHLPAVQETHTNLNDQTVAGIRLRDKPAFSVQYHPESSPGPHDSRYLFDDFLEQMNHQKNGTIPA